MRKSTLAILTLSAILAYVVITFVPFDFHLTNMLSASAQNNVPTATPSIPPAIVQPAVTLTPTCGDLQNGGVTVNPIGLPRLVDWANGTGKGHAYEFAADSENRTLGNMISYAQDLYHTATGKWPTPNMVISIHLPESQFAKFNFLTVGFNPVEGFGLIGEFPANKADWTLLDSVNMVDTGAEIGMTLVFWDGLSPDVLPPAQDWILARTKQCPNWLATPVAH